MNITLHIKSQGAPPRSLTLGNGQYSLGSQGCDIALCYPTVSRRHALVTVGDGLVSYTDMSSRNGSHLLRDDGCVESVFNPDIKRDWPLAAKIRVGPFLLSWSEAAPSTTTRTTQSEFHKQASSYARLLSENPEHAGERLIEQLAESTDRDTLLERIHREFHGDGPLHDFLRNPSCREILLNAYDELYADLGDGLRQLPLSFLNRESYEAWATRTAHAAGRRLDLQHPICEATLSNGARFHAVMAPVSARGLTIAIRRFGSAPIHEEQALASGWLDKTSLELLKSAVKNKRNIVISGGTSTGKTSLLNFLCRYLDSEDRVVTVEDTVELAPPVQNLVQLQGRSANADGVGEVSLRQLVQCALRMRPDRIIVGECRGSEVLEMLQALNTGHPGSLTTVHANSTREAISRLELLALLGAPNLSTECISTWIRSSVDLIIQVERDSAGHRHVAEIAAKTNGDIRVIYKYK